MTFLAWIFLGSRCVCIPCVWYISKKLKIVPCFSNLLPFFSVFWFFCALKTWKRSVHFALFSSSVFPGLLTQRLKRSLLRALWFVVKLKETATHAQHTSQSASTLGTRHLEHRGKNFKNCENCENDVHLIHVTSFASFYHRFCWLELKVCVQYSASFSPQMRLWAFGC